MRTVFIYLLFLIPCLCFSQRKYANQSVLATGTWAKIAVTKEGIYKIDLRLLQELGFNTAVINSSAISVWGNGGAMLPENNASERIDDLAELAIDVQDGNDGLLTGNDFIVFYAPGPHQWFSNSTNQSFSYKKNLYCDTAYYYISLSSIGTGKRIQSVIAPTNPTTQINSYTDHFVYENHLYNLLHSGKKWLGDAFSNSFGGILSRNILVNWPNTISTAPLTINTNFSARAISYNALFSISLNGSLIQQNTIEAVSGDFYGAYVKEHSASTVCFSQKNNLSFTIDFQSTAQQAAGWLNNLTVIGKRTLSFTDNNFIAFRDWTSVQPNGVGEFTINNSWQDAVVWDISNKLNPQKMDTRFIGNQTKFTNTLDNLVEYIAFTPSNYSIPIPKGKVANQNLHQNILTDGIIVTHLSLLKEAKRIAAFHLQQYGLIDAVFTTEEIYNEFSSGSPDPTAIRDCIKMMVDKSVNNTIKPKYVLLFGSGSYDPKNRLSASKDYLVPVYESDQSSDPLTSYTSDDFFGLMDDAADISNLNIFTPLSLAVGRIPVHSIEEANIMVNKIIAYHAPGSLGRWRNELLFLADDQDNNLHLDNAETIANKCLQANPILHQQKIYLDAYPLVRSTAGASYPSVNEAIVNGLLDGALILNYTGHGNYLQLTEEAVFNSTSVNRLNNSNKLPLIITASCDFAPFDDPSKQSLGEQLLHRSMNGCIALLTTTRLVFAYSNQVMNDNYLQQAITTNSQGHYLSLGEAVRIAKNNTAINNGDLLNTRKFALLGDPAMQLAFPKQKVKITHINSAPLSKTDSLQATGKYTIAGIIQSAEGEINTHFNGIAEITLYDKIQENNTLGNTLQSPVRKFSTQKSVLFKGKSTVKNGHFTCTFLMPKEINFESGEGLFSLYAYDSLQDAAGSATVLVNGSKNTPPIDQSGPNITLFLNDTLFVNGGITSENSLLIAQLFDSSGINITGNSIGHDITLVIDGDENNKLVLNNNFSYALNSYQNGQVYFQLPTLTEGKHLLTLKGWDVLNNSAEKQLQFIVLKKEKLAISAIKNFPNPFNDFTRFSFEHNQTGEEITVEIMITDINGYQVKHLNRMIHTRGSRNVEILWDGTSDNGQKLAHGVYFYRIIVKANAQQIQGAGKLLLL